MDAEDSVAAAGVVAQWIIARWREGDFAAMRQQTTPEAAAEAEADPDAGNPSVSWFFESCLEQSTGTGDVLVLCYFTTDSPDVGELELAMDYVGTWTATNFEVYVT